MVNKPEIGSVVRVNQKYRETFADTGGLRHYVPYVILTATEPGDPSRDGTDTFHPSCSLLGDLITGEMIELEMGNTEWDGTDVNLVWWGFLEQDVLLTAARTIAQRVKSEQEKGNK